MPWNNQTGGRPGNGGRGPWGGGGPSGGQPPDLEELFKRSQEKLRGMLPGGFGRGGALIAVLIVAVVWLFSGIYVVQPDQQGVVLRFGAVVAQTGNGLHYHLPWPIETVETPSVTRENQISIGFVPAADANQLRQVPEESLMLTGDENIVDISFTVFWVIKDASDYLFNVENPGNPNAAIKEATIKAVSEAAMREIVGRNQIDTVLTENREGIQADVRDLAQTVLDSYGAGVTITRVQMQRADPPSQVIDSYRDVQAARTDQERMRNEAEAYANRVIPEARGGAARIIQQAEAYREQVVAEAEGEAQRFTSILTEYENAPAVTRQRIYLETMQQIFANMNKVILDTQDGVAPYFPLPAITQGGAVRQGAVPPMAPAAGANPGANVSINGGQ